MAKQTLSQALELVVREDGALCRYCDFTVALDRMKAETSIAAQLPDSRRPALHGRR